MVRVGFLVILDREKPEASRETGEALRLFFTREPFQTALYAETEAARKPIAAAIKRWCDESLCDIVFVAGAHSISRGGCGWDAIANLLDRELLGLSLAISGCLLKIDMKNALIECRAGTRGDSLVASLPGERDLALAVVERLSPLFAEASAEIARLPS